MKTKNGLWRVLALVLTVLVAVGCAACTVDGTRRPGKGGTKTIAFWCNGNDIEIANYRQIVSDFNTLHEKDNWWVELTSPTDYYNTLERSFGAGSNPDVFFIELGQFAGFTQSGLLRELDSMLASDAYKLSSEDLWDINNEYYRYNSATGEYGKGSLYCIVKDWCPDFMLIYNKTMLAEYNTAHGTDYVIPEDRPLTWDEFYDIAEAMTVKNALTGKLDVYGTSLSFESNKRMFEHVQMTGKSLFKDDYNALNTSDADVRSAIKFWSDLQRGENAPARFTSAGTGGDEMVQFKSKKCFSVWGGLWSFTAKGLYDIEDFEYGIAYPPVPSANSTRWPVSNPYPAYATTSAMVGFSVAYNAKYPEVVQSFIDYYMNEGTETYMVEKGFNIPGNKTIASGDKFLNPSDEKVKALNNFFYNFISNPDNHVTPTEYSRKCSMSQLQSALGIHTVKYLSETANYSFDQFLNDMASGYSALVRGV